MGSQTNLASKSEGVSIYKSPKKGALLPKFGTQKHNMFDHFFRDIRTGHCIPAEWNVASKSQNVIVNLQCVP